MAQLFRPRANAFARMLLWGAVVLLLALAVFGYAMVRSTYVTAVAVAPEQPVPFSHQHHVAGLGIDCRYCHTSVEQSSFAGLPPTETCMTCHSQIWTNAEVLAPVRQSLAENKPIVWNRVTKLPDYVFFNHGIHIAKGVGCSSCHGEIVRMQLTMKDKSLTMQFCLNCHRDPGPHLRPKDQIYNTEWQRTTETPPASRLLAQYHMGPRTLTDCSICHR